MAATATAPPALSPTGTGVADLGDSNISSPLSEVDDKDTNDDDINMHLGDNEGDDALSADERPDANSQESDSESALSDAQSVVNSDANDTEAETERLFDTPEHPRQKNVVVDQFNDGQVFEHSPSKLHRAVVAQDDEDPADDEWLSGDAASIPPIGSDTEESPSKHATTKDTSVDDEAQYDLQDRKRKRSPAVDTSESEQPSRKRIGSVGIVEADVDQDMTIAEDDAESGKAQSSYHSVGEGEEGSPEKQDTPIEVTEPEKDTAPLKKVTRNGVKNKSITVNEPEEDVPDAGAVEDGDIGGVEEGAENLEEVVDGEAEEEAEAAARNAEELERKQAAFKDWSMIEEMFGIFRDRLYKDRLQRLDEEEQSLLAEEPTHPEYLNMKQCLDDRLNRKIQEINKEHELRMKANERRAVAIRSQIWSQYYQSVREKRETVLEALNKEWYDVQTARRSAHSLQDCGILFPKEPVQRIRNAVAYNTEVSTLAGLAKYEGFPAGPEMKGASGSELADDLNAIERARRTRQKQPLQPREDYYQTPTFNRLGPAGEQFLKETPWANPNHSAHKSTLQQTPTSSNGRVDLEPIPGRGTQQVPTSSTATTIEAPLSTQRSPALSNRASESPELARSVFKAAGPVKKANNIQTISRGSKTAAV